MTHNVILSGGPSHDFPTTTPMIVELFAGAGVRSTVVEEPSELLDLVQRSASGDEADRVDTVTVNALRWQMRQERYADRRDAWAVRLGDDGAMLLESFIRSGGGLLALHTAVVCFDDVDRWGTLCGARWDWESSRHPPLGPVTVQVTSAGRQHPLTEGLDDFVVEDEVYGFLDQQQGLEPLLASSFDGREHPLLWERSLGDGRVVTDLLGHGAASFAHPTHRDVLVRSIRWLSGQEAHDARGSQS